jgi:hypothetical protein
MKSVLALVVAAGAALVVATALAAPPAQKTFVVVLTTAEEVPPCAEAGNDARGVAVFQVVDEASGTVRYKVVANNLPGTIAGSPGAHIHIGPRGSAGPIVQGLELTGSEQGVVAAGTFTNPGLLAALRTSPEEYYVNVHSTVCRPGVIRGQFGDRGPRP